MVAHLRVWQHFSIDHPVYGRYCTRRPCTSREAVVRSCSRYVAELVQYSYVAELVQYLSWVGTCPEFASEPAIPAPDHAGPTRETAAEPAGTCPEFAPPLDEIRQVWTGFRRNLLEPDQVQQSPNLTDTYPHSFFQI